MTAPDYRARRKRLQRALEGRRLEAMLVTDLRNIRYLSGFTGSSAYMVISSGKSFFLTDPRYTAQARQEVSGVKVRIYRKALDTIAQTLGELKARATGFESANLTFDTYQRIKKALKGKTRLVAAPGLATGLRRRKDAFEIDRIRQAARLLDKGFAMAMKLVAAGAVEREAASSIESFWKKRGADGLAFDTIIASGARGALPHGKASDKKIGKGELVVVDMGCALNGYNSDETRTFVTGRPTARHKKVYQVVRDAQAAALESIRPGVKASMVDQAARGVIGKAGFGKYFGHGTGHGVGLDIHEGPNLGPASEDVLDEGMVVTVEPGIYIPGWGGVRIEDMALVTKDGAELLTGTTRDLVIL